ncbi:pyridoxal phosphate-dependent aminotransferase [Aureispira anguillae]|uniref:Aminotransferase n=1 Tax=Aureispira anguillae TaxID=2864201 RepID=A0A915YBG8_9BACT|nr:pyridoxal phosphate-dependent aminotransferase [Aureispira anguillae]BDS10013.1 pyridoxal phosphate-dependent aminotransferase [Aureispira anguillae]
MAESATIKMAQLARELKAQGNEVISLSLGEPDFDTPNPIKEAAYKALQEGYTKYTPVPGLVELRTAIVTKLKRDNNLDFDINQIVVSNGAKQCLANLSLALLNEGDEVVIFAPYWVSYKEIIALSGAKPVFINATIENDFKVTADQLEAAITDKTRMVLFSSPCNPTGMVYTQQDFEPLVKVLEQHPEVLVASDEIYEYINFLEEGHFSIASFESIADRCIVINGFSKGFSMTGWRLGYMAAPRWVAAACAKMQGQFTSGANAFGQKAAADALLADMTPTHEMNAAFRKRRDLVLSLLKEIDGFKVNFPEGAFYVFPDISALYGKSVDGKVINNSSDFCEYILYTAHVAIVAGVAFGADDCVRIAYSTSEDQLIEAIGRIKKAVAALS